MNKNFTLYDRKTGMLVPSRFFGDPALHETQQHGSIDGHLDALSQRVDVSGERPIVVQYQPPQPSDDHEWNPTTKRWQLNAAAQSRLDAVTTAKTRLAALMEPERHLMRQLILDPANAAARQSLQAIDAEINQLQGLLAGSSGT